MELEVGPPVTGGLGLVEDEDVGFISFHGNSRAQTGNFLKQKKLFSQAIKSKLEHPWKVNSTSVGASKGLFAPKQHTSKCGPNQGKALNNWFLATEVGRRAMSFL